jgi:hypothetical protein
MLVDGGGDSRRGLIAAIERFIDAWNDPCTPFTWIKDPDKVICQGHQPTTGQAAIPSNRRDLKLADLGLPACSRSVLMGVARSRGQGRAEGPPSGLGLDPGEDDAMLGGREQAGHAALLGAGPAVEVCS